MSTNKGRPSEQIFPWNYPQVYNPPSVYYFRPVPKKRNDMPILAIVVAVVVGAIVVPMVLSSIMFSNHYEPYDFEYENLNEPFVFYENETVPMAFVSSVNVTSPTDATVLLGNFSRDPAATEFILVLEMNEEVQGTYYFPLDTDCELVFAEGSDIADIFYKDLNHNLELDPGDEISITNLTPDSFYEVTIIYLPGNYESTYSAFWTPLR